ncbi:hypothetical protein [Robbsia sp. KACC 23696]|uniref:hypothetical protein n=1 Tax=Robbsia sp. KACC 23696 TaxID=3149231 RepID=UPI00325BE528
MPIRVDPKERWTLPAPLAERLDTFTRWPSQNLHVSWQDPADREMLTRLQAFGPAAAVFWHRAKSEALTAAHGLDDLPLPPLDPALARVVLLDATELTGLACLCGATLQAPWIRASIRRDELARWREALGEPLYTFAVRQAHRFHPIAGMTPQMLAIDGAQDAHGGMGDGFGRSPIRQTVEAIGWQVLARFAARTPDAIGRRLALKLPVDANAAAMIDPFPSAPPLAIGHAQAAPSLLPALLPAAPALNRLSDADLLAFLAALTTCLDAPWLSTFDTLP